jgi:hypothetical protein
MLACRGGGVDCTACLVKPSAMNWNFMVLNLNFHGTTLFLVKGAANNCRKPSFSRFSPQPPRGEGSCILDLMVGSLDGSGFDGGNQSSIYATVPRQCIKKCYTS